METTKTNPDAKELTLAEHQQVVAAFTARLETLTEAEAGTPRMLTARFIAAAMVLLELAVDAIDRLAAVGMPRQLVGTLEARLNGLRSAETLLRAERLEGWSLGAEKLRRSADVLRAEIYAAAVLALRRHPQGHRWALELRGGTQLLALHADLVCLTQLLWDNRSWFEGIRLDVDATTRKLTGTGRELCEAIAAERIARGLSGSKRTRDRMYTLCCETLGEVVAYAAYALREEVAEGAKWELACRAAEVEWGEKAVGRRAA